MSRWKLKIGHSNTHTHTHTHPSLTSPLLSLSSYDARSGAYTRPKEWSDPKILGERAHFTVTTSPAALVLNLTRRTDQAVYRCRVDYKHLTTTHARVNLTVIGKARLGKVRECPRINKVR